MGALLQITFYCPDQHLTYDLRTLDDIGVGGGVTGRIRMAHALAARGHTVTVYVNCPENIDLDGVCYRHFSNLHSLKTDIFVASSSGALDLSSLETLDLQALLRVIMLDGVPKPKGLDKFPFDVIYTPSNFARDQIVQLWPVPASQLFVCHRGVVSSYFQTTVSVVRNPYALVYLSHPSKGLEAALAVLRLLRNSDERYCLHIFGGQQLWGQPVQPLINEPGVIDHGLVGQRQLAQELLQCNFSLALQAREEPFGLVITDSMRAGCIVLASPVGAYPELVQSGVNGFLIDGLHTAPATYKSAAQLITNLQQDRGLAESVRSHAQHTPLDWAVIAQTWEQHWDWVLSATLPPHTRKIVCAICAGPLATFADGEHCTNCGRYGLAR